MVDLNGRYCGRIDKWVGLNVVYAFWYHSDWLLNVRTSILILVCNVVLFMISYVPLLGRVIDVKFHGALRVGLISYVVFQILLLIFFLIYRRKPTSTYWVFEKKPVEDVVFGIVFTVVGTLVGFHLAVELQ